MHRPHCAVVVLGHTGHGKTTLVDALCGQPSPPRRVGDGDVKVRRCASLSKRYTLFDVPGGARSLHASLRATPMADVAILVVASTAGPQALTREHLLVAQGMKSSVVVVINDHDGDRTLLDACELEVRSLLGEHGEAGDDAAIIVASLRDDGPRAAAEIFAVLDAAAHRHRDDEADAQLRVLFRHPGLSAVTAQGREWAVSSGQLAAGTLRVGDAVRVVGHRAAHTPLFFHSPAFQQRMARNPNVYGRGGPGWVPPTYWPPAYVPPPRGAQETLARIEGLQVARRDLDVVTAGEQVGVQLSFSGEVPRVDRFSSVVVSADHPDPAQVVLTTLTVRPSAVGGPRRRIDTLRSVVVWSGAYATLAVVVLLDEHRRDVDSVGPDSTFSAAIVLSAPRFIDVGQPLIIASNVGVFATGVVAEVVATADAAPWFARFIELRAANDARRAPALFT